MLCVNPKSLAERRADWAKVVQVWDRVATFLKDEKNLNEAATIMAARVGLREEQYKGLMKGTYFLTLEEAKKHWKDGPGLESIFGSSRIVDEFNVANNVYKTPLKVEEYLDPSFTMEPVAAR
jgi:NitT/TauT family transport system substrate-binding protein